MRASVKDYEDSEDLAALWAAAWKEEQYQLELHEEAF